MRGVTLFHVRGIRIAADWSWFFILFLFIYWLTDFYAGVMDTPQGSSDPFLLALASSLLFFASILLHELGHALAARRDGVSISGINLWMFGGITGTAETRSAGSELRVAAAGPAVTLAIVIGLTVAGLMATGERQFGDALRFEKDSGVSGPLAMVAWLATMNGLVLVLNLIPAFPLDGGRIVRAIAWWRTRDRLRATKFAATLGRFFGRLFIFGGLYLILVGIDIVGGVWLALVGFIIGQAARAALVQTKLAQAEEAERKQRLGYDVEGEGRVVEPEEDEDGESRRPGGRE